MSSTPPPRSPGQTSPGSTRQLLDELDALMQQMLRLPVNQLDEDPPAETISVNRGGEAPAEPPSSGPAGGAPGGAVVGFGFSWGAPAWTAAGAVGFGCSEFAMLVSVLGIVALSPFPGVRETE